MAALALSAGSTADLPEHRRPPMAAPAESKGSTVPDGRQHRRLPMAEQALAYGSTALERRLHHHAPLVASPVRGCAAEVERLPPVRGSEEVALVRRSGG